MPFAGFLLNRPTGLLSETIVERIVDSTAF
jgi:hypothetical protein